MPIKIKELPELERPYEKLEWYGEKTLSNAELLAIIIKTGTKQETSVQLAQKILSLNTTSQEGINFLRNISIEELTQIKGIGKVKAIQLKAVGELATRMAQPASVKKIHIKNPNDLAKIMMEEFRFERKEIARLVMLSNKNDILKIRDITIGGNNFNDVTMRDILDEPVKIKAPKIIIAHNHPTGDATPSQADIEFTSQLYKAARNITNRIIRPFNNRKSNLHQYFFRNSRRTR
ncbi:MAG: DNA repair protein RadC [Clostridia bacterium]|nr:DNA repair protein RadC [Clostridia bacterium]